MPVTLSLVNELDSVSSNGTPAWDSARYLREILKAPVYEAAEHTPLQEMPALSARLGNTVEVKREDLQTVHSFKIRGAYNAMRSLSPAERERGVVTASAGNHAQGVARSAALLGMSAIHRHAHRHPPRSRLTPFAPWAARSASTGTTSTRPRLRPPAWPRPRACPTSPPSTTPASSPARAPSAWSSSSRTPTSTASSYPWAAAGWPPASPSSSSSSCPGSKVIGVEHEESACLKAALLGGEPITLHHVGLFAEGVAVRRIGEETFRMCRALLDDVVTVSSDETSAAVRDIFDDVRAISEPSGALALAGLKRYAAEHHLTGERLAFVLSGANLNFHQLRYISERSEIGEQREAILGVTIPEEQGSFLRFASVLGARSVTEFNYRLSAARAATDPRPASSWACASPAARSVPRSWRTWRRPATTSSTSPTTSSPRSTCAP